MKTIAQASNVACKISGLDMGDWTWTTESIRPHLEEEIGAFSVERECTWRDISPPSPCTGLQPTDFAKE
ncbi:hypothetical protein [Rhizobium leguminosarum]|uniref:hypothetical protein n=1 Tax=Rhizobium leguminosarum TaxID=384 RepID=UPI003965734D